MVQWLGAHVAHVEDPSSVPKTHVRWLLRKETLSQ